MDPAILATTVLTVLAPYLAKVGDKVADKVAESLPENVGKLWATLTERFKGKPAAEEAAQDFAKNPSDDETQTVFRVQLKKALAEDPEFLQSLAGLLEKAQQSSRNGAMARDKGIAVNVGGSLDGNIVIGNLNTVNSPEKKK